ncbi:MAG: hypothetical protein WBK15_09275 [Yoonia sp.]
MSNRNLIINGAMQVAQRGTSGTHPGAGTGVYLSADRWYCNVDGGGSDLSVDVSTDAPSGFANSLYLSPDAATATLTGAQRLIVEQKIEGQNLAAWGYGTAGAKPLTMSFWVKSNLTGNVALVLESTEICGQTYSINVADTWEYKTVTFPANVSGTPVVYDNTGVTKLRMFVSASSIFTGTYAGDGVWTTIANSSSTDGTGFNLYSDIANYLNITGVQLEVGDTATPFEHRSYGDELARCQRYYEYGRYYVQASAVSGSLGTTATFKQFKRATPTVTFANLTGVIGGIASTGLDSVRSYGSVGASNQVQYDWIADAEL